MVCLGTMPTIIINGTHPRLFLEVLQYPVSSNTVTSGKIIKNLNTRKNLQGAFSFEMYGDSGVCSWLILQSWSTKIFNVDEGVISSINTLSS